MNPSLQQMLLEHLRQAALTRTQLVGRTDWTDHQVQAALDTLVGEGLVRRRPRPGRPAEYELTAAAAARLRPVTRSAGRPRRPAVVKSKRRPRWLQPSPVPVPPDPRTLVLTDAERSFCSAALAQQFDAGRIVDAELKRRSYLLYAARTRADLAAVFENLPQPDLDAPRPEPEPAEFRPDWLRYRKLGLSLLAMLVFVVFLVYSRAGLLTWLIFFVVAGANAVSAYRGGRRKP